MWLLGAQKQGIGAHSLFAGDERSRESSEPAGSGLGVQRRRVGEPNGGRGRDLDMRDRYIIGNEIGDPGLSAGGGGNSGLLMAIALLAAMPVLLLIVVFPIAVPILAMGVIGLAAWVRVSNWRRNRL